MSDDNTELIILKSEQDKSLGQSLTAARELRGLSLAAVEKQTRLPHGYIRMLEADDYTMISDQLYLLPFLRRYATFLGLDQEETGMRFVREVQRADNNPPPRMSEPLDNVRHRKRRSWGKPLMFGALVAVVIGAYIAQAHRRDAADNSASTSASGSLQFQTTTQPRVSGVSVVPASASGNPGLAASAVPPVAAVPGGVPEQSARTAQTSPSQPMIVRALVVPSESVPATASTKTMHRSNDH